MANYQDLRALTLGSTQEEEAVTVNTRALIDKVLARYSSENTTLRELIQNAADAGAQSVEVRYEMIPGSDPPATRQEGEGAELQRLVKSKVSRLIVKNDGQVFGEDDWQRLKRIAEGNPDETKIGAFGVGFYSVFADTDEPFISSGNQTMAFYWKQNSLYTRRAVMKATDPYTTFLLDYREPGDLPDLKVLCQFFATSLTFVNLQSISLYIDDQQLLVLNKKVSPPEPLQIPSSITPVSMDKLMKISAVETSRVQLDARYMNITHYKPPVETAGGFVRSFFRAVAPSAPNSKDITVSNLGKITTASIFFRVANATVITNVGPKFAKELERATKKPPPKKTVLACLTMSKDEQEASEHDNEIFENVIPSKAGKIFIGFPTHQTTSIKAHISAHSVIPTVERENIDLNARIIKTWNIEMLRIAGILSRIMYVDEMSFLEKRAQGLKLADLEKLFEDALHIMRQFTFGYSTPSAQVGAYMAEAFWSCTRYTSIELLSTRGVLPSTKIRLASDVDFLDGLPLLPEVLVKGAKEFVGHLRDGGYLSEITISDIQNELAMKPLSGKLTTNFLKWLAGKVTSGKMDSLQIEMLLSSAVVMVSKDPEGKSTDNDTPVGLNLIKHYINTSKITATGPFPSTCIPIPVSKSLSLIEMEALGWKELGVVEWISFVVTHSSRLPVEQCVEKSPKFANEVLKVVSENWEKLQPVSRGNIASLLKDKTCIPTKQGMKIPKEAYFPTVKLFKDLPIVHGLQGVRDKPLAQLGVRKTVDLNLVFERLMSDQSLGEKWSHVELIKYLAGVREDIPQEDIRKLQQTAICKAEPAESKTLYRVSQLYVPDDGLRKLRLPIIFMPGEWKEQSNEGRFLLRLGLQRYPTEEVLINLASDTTRDPALRESALWYMINNYNVHNYSTRLIAGSHAAFLPVEGDKTILLRPSQCFHDPRAALLGFRILRKDFQLYAKIFGVAFDPPLQSCCERLAKNPPRDRDKAVQLFEYFASRVMDLSTNLTLSMGNAPIVPLKTMGGLKHLSPRSCYIGDSKHKFAGIFDFVDFGPLANSFLTRCGSKPEPSPAEIAYRLARDPTKLYQVFQDNDKYLSVLKIIAEEWKSLQKDKELFRLMQQSPCFGAYKAIAIDESDNLMDAQPEEAKNTMRSFELARAADIFILDEFPTFNLFKTQILVAPEDEVLEKFYTSLGSALLSTSIEQEHVFGRELDPDNKALHRKIVERTQLFLHNNAEDVNHDARYLENNLVVKVVLYIKHKLHLKLRNGHKSTHILGRTAALVPARVGPKKHILMVTAKPTDYDIAEVLLKLVLRRPKTHSSLLFESLLTNDLQILKNRGVNVDRILRARQAEARLLEQSRLKKLEQQQKELEKQEILYQEQQRQQEQMQQQLKTIEDRNPMPGAFADSPVREPPHKPQGIEAGGFLSRGFSKFSKMLQESGADHSRLESENENRAIMPNPPPMETHNQPQMGKPTEPHRLSSNLQKAVQAGRKYDSSSVFSPPATFEVKEEHSFCDTRPGQDIIYVAETPTGMKVYMARSLPETERSQFLTTNAGALSTFSKLLLEQAGVFSMDPSVLNIFYDRTGNTIAFNLGGSLFCNIRFFLQLHVDRKLGWNADAVKYWYITLCHELAHNLVKDHGSNHSFYT
ncbi:hypothetical protein EDC01DRAFT_494524 [Geopyxis carbonaria]|nr:hypothetical protein EDC01DRAFT_494524 [Geopyxis carbonaria]